MQCKQTLEGFYRSLFSASEVNNTTCSVAKDQTGKDLKTTGAFGEEDPKAEADPDSQDQAVSEAKVLEDLRVRRETTLADPEVLGGPTAREVLAGQMGREGSAGPTDLGLVVLLVLMQEMMDQVNLKVKMKLSEEALVGPEALEGKTGQDLAAGTEHKVQTVNRKDSEDRGLVSGEAPGRDLVTTPRAPTRTRTRAGANLRGAVSEDRTIAAKGQVRTSVAGEEEEEETVLAIQETTNLANGRGIRARGPTQKYSSPELPERVLVGVNLQTSSCHPSSKMFWPEMQACRTVPANHRTKNHQWHQQRVPQNGRVPLQQN